jgi:hypothetical protein
LKDWIIELLRTLYGTKQAAKRFWLFLLGMMASVKYRYNKVDPCLYYRWDEEGLRLWASWVDDLIHIGPTEDGVIETKKEITSKVSCDDQGKLSEYVGCKIEHDVENAWLKMTQPVLIQSLRDEFDLPDEKWHTPAKPGSVLQDIEGGVKLKGNDHTSYRSGIGKMLHSMRWSRPDTLNATRETSRFMGGPNTIQDKAAKGLMKYCVDTPNRGLVLKPYGRWDGKDKSYEFVILGKGDSEYAKDVATRRSVGGHVVYLNGAVVVVVCRMQKIVAISVTEAELIQQCELAQDMLYVFRLLREMLLTVKLPMVQECDNQGTVDLVNNWSSSGRTQHIDVRYKFLRELKEQGLIRVIWTPSHLNKADVFTKNLDRRSFEKCIKFFFGEDEYMIKAGDSEGEGVGSNG